MLDTVDFIKRIKERRIKFLSLLLTNRCISRCKHCNVWHQKPKVDLPIEIVENIAKDIQDDGATVRLSGGEPLLHSRFEKIIPILNDYSINCILLSNALLPEKLIKICNRYEIKELSISLDGVGKNYKKTRGVDGFEKVKMVLDELNGSMPLVACYTINPFNTKQDLVEVSDFLSKYDDVRLVIGIYDPRDCFNVYHKPFLINPNYLDGIKNPRVPKFLFKKFIQYHNDFVKGKLKVQCLNIKAQTLVLPNADVLLCEGLPVEDAKLGNLKVLSLSDMEQQRNNKKTE